MYLTRKMLILIVLALLAYIVLQATRTRQVPYRSGPPAISR